MIKTLYQSRLLTTILTTLILSTIAPARTQSVLITDFGAVGDGKTCNTKAIQAAIDK
jgi:polygalacturonase